MVTLEGGARCRTETRDSASWYVHLPGGRVGLVVLRRVPLGQGGWEEVTTEGRTKAEAERRYRAECGRRYAAAQAQQSRRARWGADAGVVVL